MLKSAPLNSKNLVREFIVTHEQGFLELAINFHQLFLICAA